MKNFLYFLAVIAFGLILNYVFDFTGLNEFLSYFSFGTDKY